MKPKQASEDHIIKSILGLCVDTLKKKGYTIVYASLATEIINEDIYFIMIKSDTPLDHDSIKDIPSSWGDEICDSFTIIYMDNITSYAYDEILISVSNLYFWTHCLPYIDAPNP